jgi:small subunit ribosomal protein S14
MNIRVLRDIAAREGYKTNEAIRRAYLFVARNQKLPASTRYRAQLQLDTFTRYTRPTTIKNRCIASGKGRGIISEFGLTRVRYISYTFSTLTLFLTVSISSPCSRQHDSRSGKSVLVT